MGTISNFYLDIIKGRPSAEAVHAVACVYSMLDRRLAEYFKPFGLSPVKFNCLMLIKHMGGQHGISQNDICKHMIVSAANITRLLDRLSAEGYIERHACPKDRRVKRITVTPKGSEILDKAFHGYGETVQQSAYLLERKDVEQLSSLLLKWFAKLEENTP